MKTKFLTPGKYHWLNWWSTAATIFVGYGLYQVLSIAIIVLTYWDIKAKSDFTNSWFVLDLTILYGFIALLWVLKLQQNFELNPFKWSRWGKYISLSLLTMIGGSYLNTLVFNPILSPTKQVGTNQKSIDIMTQLSTPGMTFTIVSVALLSPIFEETVFRLLAIGPDKVTRPSIFTEVSTKRKLYLIVSTIIFVYLHVFDDFNKMVSQWGLHVNQDIFVLHETISYTIIASVLVFAYYKTKDIRYSLSIHILWNLISLLPLIMSLLK